MKISFTCNGDIRTAYNQLSRMLDSTSIENTLWDDLTLELPTVPSRDLSDAPSEIMDLVNDAIDVLAQDFGIDLEIDAVSES